MLLDFLMSHSDDIQNTDGSSGQKDQTTTDQTGQKDNKQLISDAHKAGYGKAFSVTKKSLIAQGYDIQENDEGELDLDATLAKGKKVVPEKKKVDVTNDDDTDHEKVTLQNRLNTMEEERVIERIDTAIERATPAYVANEKLAQLGFKDAYEVKEVSKGTLRVYKDGQVLKDSKGVYVTVKDAFADYLKEHSYLILSDYRENESGSEHGTTDTNLTRDERVKKIEERWNQSTKWK